MIKVLVCDGDGTLLLPSPPDEIHALLQSLKELRILLVVATNTPAGVVARRFRASNLDAPALIVSPEVVGEHKPSPKFIDYIAKQMRIDKREIILLGDDDKTDIFCATNAGVLPFAALYSKAGKPLSYGLPVNSPLELSKYLRTYAHQDEPFFGWEYKDISQKVEVYALFGEHGDMGLTPLLKQFLKDKTDIYVGVKKNSFGRILFHYLLSQTYLSGLVQGVDYISVYPGHQKGSQNQILAQFSEIFPKIFNQRFLAELLIRHTDTAPSHHRAGNARNIYDQLSTIHLNRAYKKRLLGKTVLVLDDFTTSGNSLETARQMLFAGGASRVVGLAFAKYRLTYNIATVNGQWDPFIPFSLTNDAISVISQSGAQNKTADDYFYNVIWNEAKK